jgi:hypothetical protein
MDEALGPGAPGARILSRLTAAVLAATIALLLVGAFATRAEGSVRDPGKRHYYASAPRALDWYWWPEATR